MACPHCGSWSVKADRSLAGRLVCGSCGRPLVGASATRPRRSRMPRLSLVRSPQSTWRWLLLLLALSACLAWLAEPAADPGGRPIRSPAAPRSFRDGV